MIFLQETTNRFEQEQISSSQPIKHKKEMQMREFDSYDYIENKKIPQICEFCSYIARDTISLKTHMDLKHKP